MRIGGPSGGPAPTRLLVNGQAMLSSRYARAIDRLCARYEIREEALGIAVIGQALRDAGARRLLAVITLHSSPRGRVRRRGQRL